MAVVHAVTAGLSRDEWLQLRQQGLGGSDAAAACGLDPYKSPVVLWLEKTGQVPPEDQPSEAARWGELLQDVIAEEFARRNGLKVRRRNAILRHPKHSWMLANVDRLIVGANDGPGVLEIKTGGHWRKEEWADGRVPDRYMLQLQHYLAVTGYQYGFFAVLLGGQQYVQVRVERDDELIDELIRLEADFWRHVEDGTPPAFDGSEASSELLKRLYPDSEPGKTVRLPIEARDLIEAYLKAKDEAKEAEARAEEAANRLKALIGDAEVGLLDDWRVTWKSQVRRTLDTKALQRDMPEVYERYLRESTCRTFSIK